ncbi:MAG: hypothetical protein JSS87_06970 [Acidobacteria bacterium]|nr:hypothetical protein [Acidobacteriota bacterium]
MRRILVLLVAVCTAVFSASLIAQTNTPKKFVFINPGPYTDAQLIASSGMKVGQPFTVADLQKAAQTMIDSGAFEQLEPTLEGPFKAITVTFKLKPVAKEKFLPATFENFVWFTPAELSEGLHKRVPLYANGIPEAGNLSEQVRKALVEMLAEKGVANAEVSALEQEPSAALPTSAWSYSVTKPAVMLAGVSLNGVSADMTPKVNDYLRTIVGKPYQEGHGADTDDMILGIYRDEGYLDAKVENLQRVPTKSASGDLDIKLTGTVVPGEVYHVKSIEWKETPELSSAEFEKANPLHAGDVAARKQLRVSVRMIKDAYKHHGYLFVAVDPHTTRDSATHTVTYSYTATPGDQYHMGNLSVVGLPPEQMKEFQSAWKIKPGDVYDNTYTSTFLRQNTALQSLSGYVGKFEYKADTNTHTVDVTLVFMQARRRVR